MKKIIFAVLLILIIVACKKTVPQVTDVPSEPQVAEPEDKEEDIQVIEQVTDEETVDEEQPVLDDLPEKPDESIEEIAPTAVIKISDLKFIPKELNVSVNTVVIFQHRDEYGGKDFIKHVLTIYPPRGAGASSPPMFVGDEYNYTVNQIGRYRYVSVPYMNRMAGYINVKE